MLEIDSYGPGQDPICPYIRLLHERGLSFSRSTAGNYRRYLVNDILPPLGGYLFEELTSLIIEDWRRSLPKGSRTKNIRTQVLRIIYREALRTGVFIGAFSFHRIQTSFFQVRKKDSPITRNHVKRSLQRACTSAGIDWEERSISTHSWRHYVNTRFLEAGVSSNMIRALLGYSTISMTDRYSHADACNSLELKSTLQTLAEQQNGLKPVNNRATSGVFPTYEQGMNLNQNPDILPAHQKS